MFVYAAILGMTASFAPAQSTFGSFTGTVRDPSGAAVASCMITVINKGTAARRSTLTDDKGSYVVVNVEPGTYELSMEAPGFQKAAFTNVEVQARETVRLDGNLTLAAQTSTVSVTSAAEAVITTDVSSIAVAKTGRELVDLPKQVSFVTSLEDDLDLILFFTKSRAELSANFSRLSSKLAPAGMLWIAWPKKASGVETDLSDYVVRDTGLEAGLVDVKVCAVNDVWSGLKFVIRVKDRPRAKTLSP